MSGSVAAPPDGVQQALADYGYALSYEALPPQVVHAAKTRVIDTLGILIGGLFAEPCRIIRDVAVRSARPDGATVVGTAIKTAPDMAAFANATAARYLEFSDVYHWPGSTHGHPSDVVMPVFAAAEHAHASGREFIAALVLAYEVYCRIADVFHNAAAYDNSNFACVGAAAGAGKALRLSAAQLGHCLAMAVVPNLVLRQARSDHLTMWKEVAAGHAGRAAVFAAMLARTGMEGPHQPFEGKAGWCAHVAQESFTLPAMGGRNVPFKILDTWIRHRPCVAVMIAAILAAEKIAPVGDLQQVRRVKVEVDEYAKNLVGTGPHRWDPTTREMADHSIPYVVAAALMDGGVTLRSFDEAHLQDAQLRALLPKIEVLANDEFTQAHGRIPRTHHARVTVERADGTTLVGVAGGGKDDIASPRSDAEIEDKFHGLVDDYMGSAHSRVVLERLWQLEDIGDVADIPGALAVI